MVGRKKLARRAGVILAVLLSSTGLTACHELYCAFLEGLTAQPLDCSHEDFPDLGGIEFPPLPPPPSLPSTTTSTTISLPSTTITFSPITTTSTTSTTSTTLGTGPGASSFTGADSTPPSASVPDYTVPSFTVPTWTVPPVPSASRLPWSDRG